MPKRTTAQIQEADAIFLERRGAIAHRGARTFSRSSVLHRELQQLRALLVHYDPRRTSGMSEEMHRLVVRLLPEPWTLKPTAVEHLALRLQEAPAFAVTVAAAGVDPAALVDTVAALGFGEKVALLDHALQEQAPAAAAAEEENELNGR
jgi:hypothetical protein